MADEIMGETAVEPREGEEFDENDSEMGNEEENINDEGKL